MISMVDSDGDGQVSYEEFHRLVIDPDLSRADFGSEPIKTEAQQAAQVTQASGRRMEAIYLGGSDSIEEFREGRVRCWNQELWRRGEARPRQKCVVEHIVGRNQRAHQVKALFGNMTRTKLTATSNKARYDTTPHHTHHR